MRGSPLSVSTTIVAGLLMAACTASPSLAPLTSPSAASPSSVASPAPSPTSSEQAASPSAATDPAATVGPAALPVHEYARGAGEDVLLAPGPVGDLYVSIPTLDGSVLAMLDRSGQLLPGWPIFIPGKGPCGQVLPVDDGTVRAVCPPPPERPSASDRVWAFDIGGKTMPGWPVDLRLACCGTGRIVGDALIVHGIEVQEGGSGPGWALLTLAVDGSVRRGLVARPDRPPCCAAWRIGPDGIAYGTTGRISGGAITASHLLADGAAGVQAGFPIAIEGAASAPSFDADGRIVVTVGSVARGTSRVLAFEPSGGQASATSEELPMVTAESGVDCVNLSPSPPIVAQNGTIFAFNQAAVFGVDPEMHVIPGWPYAPATPLVFRIDDDPRQELVCGSLSSPAAGLDGTLYVPLSGRDETVGGTLAAIAPDGGSRAGWPVELQRAGSEFWSVAVGPDGIVYALATEREPGGGSSATILAIAPDSTVLARTTIIDP